MKEALVFPNQWRKEQSIAIIYSHYLMLAMYEIWDINTITREELYGQYPLPEKNQHWGLIYPTLYCL